MEGDFFAGELYLDARRETYVALEMKQLTMCDFFCILLNPKTIAKARAVSIISNLLKNYKCFSKFIVNLGTVTYCYLCLIFQKDGIVGNDDGDSKQNGGCIVVTNGGRDVPLVFREQNPAFHVPNKNVVSALNINEPISREPKY